MTFLSQHIAVFLATSGHSGVDRLMDHLIRGFVAAGHTVDLLQVRNHGPYLENLPAGIRCIDLGTRHVATALLPLMRYLRQQRPTVLLCDKYRVNRTALLAAAFSFSNVRVAVRTGTTVSVDLASRSLWQRWAEKSWMRCLYPYAYTVLTPSQGAALDLARTAHLSADFVRAIPSPLFTDELAAQAAEPIDHPWLADKDRPVILGVGELCSRKDFDTLIRAFARMRATQPTRLIILGEGRARARLQTLAKELGVAQDVSLPGFIRNPYAYMARADVFAMTSRWEGAPVALIEALALGTPVVATDCPSGPREILKDGLYGPLVPIGEPILLAQALSETLRQPLAKPLLQDAARPYEVQAATEAYLKALGLSRNFDQIATSTRQD